MSSTRWTIKIEPQFMRPWNSNLSQSPRQVSSLLSKLDAVLLPRQILSRELTTSLWTLMITSILPIQFFPDSIASLLWGMRSRRSMMTLLPLLLSTLIWKIIQAFNPCLLKLRMKLMTKSRELKKFNRSTSKSILLHFQITEWLKMRRDLSIKSS